MYYAFIKSSLYHWHYFYIHDLINILQGSKTRQYYAYL